jgi:tRNA/tmRNA/rRNA uracil-C5-methylase (TrmA/RlmC/RlmD family)
VQLAKDFQVLASTHQLQRFAVLDHFPGTTHLECAAVLTRRHQE